MAIPAVFAQGHAQLPDAPSSQVSPDQVINTP
jgi:hypothetical protein